MAEFLDGLLIARPIPNGHTFTLASRLGEILHDAETRYGPRDMSFTLLGVEFRDGTPGVWFPGNRKHVAIQLSLRCLTDEAEAVFELSQEIVHVLSPVVGPASVLEEGVSVLFAIDEARRWYPSSNHGTPAGPYREAAELVGPLVRADLDLIKRVRVAHPSLSALSPDDLLGFCPQLDSDTAVKLCSKFA